MSVLTEHTHILTHIQRAVLSVPPSMYTKLTATDGRNVELLMIASKRTEDGYKHSVLILTTKDLGQEVVRLTTLEEQDGNLTEIEVDKVAGFVRHVGAEVSAYDAVPRRVVLLVEFFLDEGRYVLPSNKWYS